jgi:hypothetical protein
MLRFITEFALSRSASSLQANLLVQPGIERAKTTSSAQSAIVRPS